MIALVKFLFITICVLWLIKLLVRMVLPLLFQNMINKAQQQQGNSRYREQQRSRPTGKISIDYIPPKDKEARAADKAGDFIDFEEIK